MASPDETTKTLPVVCPMCRSSKRAEIPMVMQTYGDEYRLFCPNCEWTTTYMGRDSMPTPERAPFLDEIKAHSAALAQLRRDVDVLQKLAIGGPAFAAASYAMPQDDAKARGELCDALRTAYEGLATALATDAPPAQIRDLATAVAKCAFTISAFYSDRGAPR